MQQQDNTEPDSYPWISNNRGDRKNERMHTYLILTDGWGRLTVEESYPLQT